MDIKTALPTTESKESSEVARSQAESGDVKTSAEELAAFLRRVSDAPIREIEGLVNELQRLRTQLETAGNRIQRDVAEYTELSQQTTQLTAIITDSLKNLPRRKTAA
jgi:flagellar biosynthesis chaperone FliJ